MSAFYRKQLSGSAQIAVREQRRTDDPGTSFYWVISAPLSDFVHHDGTMTLDEDAQPQDAAKELVSQLLSYADWWREHAVEALEGFMPVVPDVMPEVPDGFQTFPDEVARWALQNTPELAGIEFELAIAPGLGISQ